MSRQLAPAGHLPTSTSTNETQQQQTQDGTAAGVPITEEEVVGYREQDRFLPINNIQRLMKRALPESSKIAKDTKECIQEATSEFISFITSEAADRATTEKRKTITGDDILYALKTLGFDEMSEVLLIYLVKYRELQNKEPTRKRVRKAKGPGGLATAMADEGESSQIQCNGHSTQNGVGDEDDAPDADVDQSG